MDENLPATPGTHREDTFDVAVRGLLAGVGIGILLVALAPSVPVVLVGWCMAQMFFNALLAALVAVLPAGS